MRNLLNTDPEKNGKAIGKEQKEHIHQDFAILYQWI